MARKKVIDPEFLHLPRDTLLTDERVSGSLVSGSGVTGKRKLEILEALANNGVRTYGELLKFSITNSFSEKIPGIELEAVEIMKSFIIGSEYFNKAFLKDEYDKALEKIKELKKQQPIQQLERAAGEGREIAKSM